MRFQLTINADIGPVEYIAVLFTAETWHDAGVWVEKFISDKLALEPNIVPYEITYASDIPGSFRNVGRAKP